MSDSEFVQYLHSLPTFQKDLDSFNRKRLLKLKEQAYKFKENYNVPLVLPESNDATATIYTTNSHLKNKAVRGALSHAMWEQEHPNLTLWGYLASMTPFVVAAAPALGAAGESAVGTLLASGVGNFVRTIALAYPKVATATLAALTAPMVYNGVKDVSQGKFTPITALDLAAGIPVVSDVILTTPEIINTGKQVINFTRLIPFQKLMAHPRGVIKMATDVATSNSNPFNWRNYKFLGDNRFYADLESYPLERLMAERKAGNYPLTFTERRNYVTGLKSDIQKGVDYAIDEAKTNLKTPLILGKEVEYTFDGGKGWILDPYSPEDILPPRIHYGTSKATKEYGQTPWEGDYGAFKSDNGLFFPFRDKPNTLRTHSMFLNVGERIQVGAHEARHVVLSYFDTPLTQYIPKAKSSYNVFTNPDLPNNFRKIARKLIKSTNTAGEWEGSLGEMDAELTGWSALYGLPRYSRMSPKQKALVHKLFGSRFKNNQNYLYVDDLELSDLYGLTSSDIKARVESLDNSTVGLLILGLEKLGYRKQGGKLNA